MLAAALVTALAAGTAQAAEEPFGWETCEGGTVEACTAHVVASCDGAASRVACLGRHHRAWRMWGVDLFMGRTLVDMRRQATRTDRPLSGALAAVMAPPGACGRDDVECHLGYAIRGALGLAGRTGKG